MKNDILACLDERIQNTVSISPVVHEAALRAMNRSLPPSQGFVLRKRRSRAKKTTQSILPKGENFTREHSERLHKRPEGATSQARLAEKGEEVKKSLRLLSEVVLRTVK